MAWELCRLRRSWPEDLGAGYQDVDGDGVESEGEQLEESASEDTASDEESGEEVEAAKAESEVLGVEGVYPEVPMGGVWISSARGTVHRGLGQDTPHAACGYGLRWVTARWAGEWPAGVHPLCRRTSCFPV